MANKIKVLQSVNSLGIGGNVIFVMNFFRHIDKEKFQVDFVIYDDTKMNFYDEVKKAGSQVFIIKKKYKNKYLNLLSQMRQVRRFLKNNHYDIIHCHSCSFVGIFRGAIPGFFTKNTKVIAHAHNPGTPKNTRSDIIIRNILKKIMSTICNMGFACSNESGASKYTSKFMNSNKYQIINNAIDTEKFYFNQDKRDEIRKKYNIENKFVIGSIGRLEKQKNYLFMIDVMNEYIKVNKNSCFFLVGDGNQKEAILAKAEKLNILQYIIMAGQTETPEEYYSAMDCFVLPSIYEGFGFVNIEAQVSGLPCLVSKAVPKEVDISNNIKFLELVPEIWSKEIDNVRKSKQRRSTIITEKYDLKNECKRLESFYKSVIKNRKETSNENINTKK